MKYQFRKNTFLLHKHFSELAQVTPGEMDLISAFVELIHQPQYHTLLAGGSAIFIKTQSLFKGASYPNLVESLQFSRCHSFDCQDREVYLPLVG